LEKQKKQNEKTKKTDQIEWKTKMWVGKDIITSKSIVYLQNYNSL
jgi:hypothetical protein